MAVVASKGSSGSSQGKQHGNTFQNFHELFKKCSVRNQPQAGECSMQAAPPRAAETHQHSLATHGSRALPSK